MKYLRTSAVLMARGIHAAGATVSQAVKQVDPAEFHELVKKKEGIVLDLRISEETAMGKIESAVELDFFRKDFVQKLEAMDRSMPIYVYCGSGSRSMSTSNLLVELGFDEIVNLVGGFFAWENSGFAIENKKSHDLYSTASARGISNPLEDVLS
ncbi:rhodanese-like domain-containing protein [Puniceicoccaceae bacterium K14]|nr:rhodanese-like domain-containing protein [Puniceicoccaceae bacterium K14]